MKKLLLNINALKFVLTICFFVCQGKCYLFSQVNLVPNGDFESYSYCPYNQGQINAVGWYSPTGSTPDFFNVCCDTIWASTTYTMVGIPHNLWGYQFCNSGTGCTGVFSFNNDNNDHKEYLQVKLDSAMQSGKNYYVEFYCNTANLLDVNYTAGSNNIGVAFTDTAYTKFFDSVGNPYIWPLFLTPAIKSDSIISDTIGWTKVSGYYTALGGEQFITIGNFFTDAQTLYENIMNPGDTSSQVGTYFYIDDVFVGLADTTGVEENTIVNDIFSFYPNPANSELFFSSSKNCDVEIVDISGRKIQRINNIQEHAFSTFNIQNGLYIVNIYVDGVLVETRKQLIQH